MDFGFSKFYLYWLSPFKVKVAITLPFKQNRTLITVNVRISFSSEISVFYYKLGCQAPAVDVTISTLR